MNNKIAKALLFFCLIIYASISHASDFIITETAFGFAVTKQNDDVEQYDVNGQLVSETDSRGNSIIIVQGA